jgi:hypothetical protein
MNWRRGLLLAGINLAVAAPLMILQEAGYWAVIRTNVDARTELQKELIAEGEISFNLCYGELCYWPANPEREEVIPIGNLPIALLSGGICRVVLSRVLTKLSRVGSAEREDPRSLPFPFSAREQRFSGFWLVDSR